MKPDTENTKEAKITKTPGRPQVHLVLFVFFVLK